MDRYSELRDGRSGREPTPSRSGRLNRESQNGSIREKQISSSYGGRNNPTMLQGRDETSIDPRMAQGQTQRPPKRSERPSNYPEPSSSRLTKLQGRDHQNSIDPRLSQEQSQRPPPSALHSTRPSDLPLPPAASTFLSKRDIEMASRQTQIMSMKGQERQEQDEWARDQLKKNSGNCPAGYRWRRIERGYQCYGGAHRVTDELLEEGRGGFMQKAPKDIARPFSRETVWEGPFYGDEGDRRYHELQRLASENQANTFVSVMVGGSFSGGGGGFPGAGGGFPGMGGGFPGVGGGGFRRGGYGRRSGF